LEQPYRDLPSAAWNRLQNELPSGLDLMAYVGLRLWSFVFLSADVRQHSPHEMITEIPADVPIVIAAGSADRHARIEDVRAVFSQVQSHAKLVVFEGARHQSLYKFDPELYSQATLDFLSPGVPPNPRLHPVVR
jgi:alpha-beta hydrolase superfamily lysophospholipase